MLKSVYFTFCVKWKQTRSEILKHSIQQISQKRKNLQKSDFSSCFPDLNKYLKYINFKFQSLHYLAIFHGVLPASRYKEKFFIKKIFHIKIKEDIK